MKIKKKELKSPLVYKVVCSEFNQAKTRQKLLHNFNPKINPHSNKFLKFDFKSDFAKKCKCKLIQKESFLKR